MAFYFVAFSSQFVYFPFPTLIFWLPSIFAQVEEWWDRHKHAHVKCHDCWTHGVLSLKASPHRIGLTVRQLSKLNASADASQRVESPAEREESLRQVAAEEDRYSKLLDPQHQAKLAAKCKKKKKKKAIPKSRKRNRQSVPVLATPEDSEEGSGNEEDGLWIQCDNCERWKCLPAGYKQFYQQFTSSKRKFLCKLNPDKSHNSCKQQEVNWSGIQFTNHSGC